MRTPPVMLVVSSAVVLAAVVGGLVLLGSPSDERERRIDERRVSDLTAIASATDLYWTRHSALPESLGELVAEPGVKIVTVDPASADTYDYRTLDSIRYELCATFDQESGEISTEPSRDLWAHGAGRHCFQLDAEQLTRDEG